MPTFKEGDVVSGVTGGVLMTVEDIRTDDLVSTVRFGADGVVYRDAFSPLALQKWIKSI